MDLYYLVIFESNKTIKPLILDDDDPKILKNEFDKLGYRSSKQLKRRNGFSKLYDGDIVIYYRVAPCLKINNRFFELKELPISS